MPNVTAIVLAAGLSTRMDNVNKLLLPFKGKTILEWVVDTVVSASVTEVIVVTGHEDRQIRDILSSYPVRVAYNPEFASGISTSIRRGILATQPTAEGFMICLADMPAIKPSTYTLLLEVFSQQEQPAIVVASASGRRGNPVIFHRDFRGELLQLRGDQGAKSIIELHPDLVVEVDTQDEGIFLDIDTRVHYDHMRSE